MNVLFTPLAQRQLDRLFDYIAIRASEAVAEIYIRRVVDYCYKLEHFPHRGNSRDDILPGLRTIGFERRITIAFVVLADRVLIEGVFNGGQDFETILRPQ